VRTKPDTARARLHDDNARPGAAAAAQHAHAARVHRSDAPFVVGAAVICDELPLAEERPLLKVLAAHQAAHDVHLSHTLRAAHSRRACSGPVATGARAPTKGPVYKWVLDGPA